MLKVGSPPFQGLNVPVQQAPFFSLMYSICSLVSKIKFSKELSLEFPPVKKLLDEALVMRSCVTKRKKEALMEEVLKLLRPLAYRELLSIEEDYEELDTKADAVLLLLRIQNLKQLVEDHEGSFEARDEEILTSLEKEARLFIEKECLLQEDSQAQALPK